MFGFLYCHQVFCVPNNCFTSIAKIILNCCPPKPSPKILLYLISSPQNVFIKTSVTSTVLTFFFFPCSWSRRRVAGPCCRASVTPFTAGSVWSRWVRWWGRTGLSHAKQSWNLLIAASSAHWNVVCVLRSHCTPFCSCGSPHCTCDREICFS